jgi:TolB-like protein
MDRPFPAYHGDDPYVFVSYAHDDADLVFPEMQRLKDAGFNVWYDEGIRPGSTWREEVALALTESKLFLYFVTDSSVKSENCHQELNFALSRERRILAVHLTPTQLTAGIELSLSNKQAIIKHEMPDAEFTSKFVEAVRSLMPVTPIAVPGISTPKEEIDKQSIAILPFNNRSSDPENDYLCEGIAEELITGLSKIDGLTVASQLHSFAFKGQTQDVSAIGQKLRTAHVLTGSVQKSGQRVRITATLTETSSGNVIWSERYDGTMEDVFELQEDVANKVVEALKLELLPEQTGTPIVNSGTRDSAAYQAFLRGRHELSKNTRQSLLAAHEAFERAIEIDPGFSRAYYYDLLTWMSQRSLFQLPAEVAAERASERLRQTQETGFELPSSPRQFVRWIDPEKAPPPRAFLAELVDAFNGTDRTWNGAEYMHLGQLLGGAGYLNASAAFLKSYWDRYPSMVEHTPVEDHYGYLLFALGRFDQAIDHYTAVYSADPDQILALGSRAMVYSRTGQYARAGADLEVLGKVFPRNFAQFYDLFWRRELDAANAYFEWMEDQQNLNPTFKAWGCLLLDHIDRGLEYIAHWDPWNLSVTALYPLTPSMIRKVTDHSRYKELMAGAGIDERWIQEIMDTANSLEEITGIHVAPDEDY